MPFDDKSLATVCVAVNRGAFLPPSAFVAHVSPGLDAWFRRAFARAEDAQRAFDAGYQIHVAQPVEAVQLATVVANLGGRILGGA